MEHRDDHLTILLPALVAVLHLQLHGLPDPVFASLSPKLRWAIDGRRARALFESRFAAGTTAVPTKEESDSETSTK
jgi:hypothetical protein